MANKNAVRIASTVLTGFISITVSAIAVTVTGKVIPPTSAGKKAVNALVSSAATGYGLHGVVLLSKKIGANA